MIVLRQIKNLKFISRSLSTVVNTCQSNFEIPKHRFQLSTPVFDEEFLLNPQNVAEISENVNLRKGIGNIHLVYEINNRLKTEKLSDNERTMLKEQLHGELKKIPNRTHPEVRNYGEEPRVVGLFNEKPTYKHKPLDFLDICEKLNIIRTKHLGNFNGSKSYYLLNDLAELEQALIRYTTSEILSHGFNLISVPDILPAEVIQSCGFQVDGERTQVYRLHPSNLCLSGTSEMALAGYFAGSRLEKLPTKVTAVSRCFRAETSKLQEEKGIYRVHQFTKVEMFAVCRPSESEILLNEFRDIEIDLFKNLGLHFQLLDMPPHELGAPAFRKYDIEAWMEGRQIYGEISSCSNCTDYQSRRLDIKIKDTEEFAHTVNGTACAIPRMLIAIIETFQRADGSIHIPEPLQKFMKKDKIVKRKLLPELKLVKSVY